MKRKQCWLLLSLILTSSIYGQTEVDCDYNFKEALSYIQLSQNFSKDSLKVIALLEPCLKKGDDKAQLLMGKMYTEKGDEKSYEKAFNLFKKSAKNGNVDAMLDLGIFYKYGRGCDLNLNKARKWFKEAAELGNNKAAYSLGYLYLKGFGDINQDYNKAIKWFEGNEYPMAKYWLGICYYYGYGVEQNINKANELLGTNFEIVVSDNEINTDEVTTNISESNIINSNQIIDSVQDFITDEFLFGKWTGSLLKYDWSGKHIEQNHPINIEFKYDSINNIPLYSFNILNQIFTGVLKRTDNTIYFENFEVKLPHASFNKKIPSELDYNLMSCDFILKELNKSYFLVGNFDNYIEKWDEPGAPLRLVLKKRETFANSNEVISDEITQALAQQEDKFIKLYPNPFQTDLIISYKLDKPSFVQVEITDVNSSKKSILEKGNQQKAGNHSYFFDGSILGKGIHIIRVIVNYETKTAIIVKK